MLKVSLYNQSGQVIGEQDLNPKIWCVKPVVGLIQEALRAQMANSRQILALTKKRGEVRGGGRKPWKQKGTGRARHGSIRSPLWRGGGIIFGPQKERSYSLKMNKKASRKALLMCLSDKVTSRNLIVVEGLNIKDKKTKNLVKVLNFFPIQNKKTLIVLSRGEKEIAMIAKNLPNRKAIAASSINVKDILNYPMMFTTIQGIQEIEKTYGGLIN